jgi:serine/threonine protein kinase/tetratricopeptide (TPR) repeat protein
MTDTRSDQAKRLFEVILVVKPEQRRVLLQTMDPELRDEVESLLAADEDSALEKAPPRLDSGSVDKSTAVRPMTVPEPQDRIGPYRILREIGEGGMGIVYAAEQEKPVHRKVALKLIKWGMDTKAVIARFESERQALAMMNHPSIASVFDAGATDQGRPYFAMEYVHGIPITNYCDMHRLTIEERIRLFMRVCEGVQHAHQKGIIHRDIKPSNVLVAVQDDKPVPKIIDFGVAKATSHRLTEYTVATELGQLIGTPEYMSPEQAEMTNLDIDTRTDVYSLGVLLYELLAGAQPFDLKGFCEGGLAEIQRKLREEDPPRPSMRLTRFGELSRTSAWNRRVEVKTLLRQLKGDLDWITMKALEKDRTRRYDTANALAHDLERYLNSEPIGARAPTTFYRAGRFIRRHRYGAGISGAVMILAIGFVISLVHERTASDMAREKAERESAKAKAVTEFLRTTLGSADPYEGTGRNVTVLRALDQAVVKLDESFEQQPETKAAVQYTIGFTYLQLGRLDDAESLLRASLDLRLKSSSEQNLDVAESQHGLGSVFMFKGELAPAEPLLRRSLDTRRILLGPHHLDVAASENDLGLLLFMKGDLETADRLYRDALSIWRNRYGDRDEKVATALNNLAGVLSKKGALDEAEQLLREALALKVVQRGSDHPDVATARHNLAGVLLRRRAFEEAESLYLEALELRRSALGPDNAYSLRTAEKLAELYEAWGAPEKAAEYRALVHEAEEARQ